MDDIIKLLKEAADAADNVIIYEGGNFSYDKEMFNYSSELLLQIPKIIKSYDGELKEELDFISLLITYIVGDISILILLIQKKNVHKI